VRTFLSAVGALTLLAFAVPASAQVNTDDCYREGAPPAQAVAACSAIIASGQLGGKALADVYFNRGLAYQGQQRIDSALDDYTVAIRLNPTDAASYANRGNCYEAKGQNALAVADYNQALILSPKDAQTYFNRGFTYHELGEDDLAIADFDQALALDPSIADAYGNRGLAYIAKGKYDLAIADFNRELALTNENADAVYFGRAAAYLRLGRIADAGDDYARVAAMSTSADAPYAAVWMHIARLSVGRDDTVQLAQLTSAFNQTAWPAPVFEFFLGKRSIDSTLAAASSTPERCLATVAVAAWEHTHGRLADANRRLKVTLPGCPRYFGFTAPSPAPT
jgi:tetratricopeptide (TPR) repeat protein